MPGSLSPWPEVKIGSNGHPIQTLQYLLRARGHNVVVDGAFGPQTEAAVKAFQASRGSAANGIVDPNTWAALVVEVKKGRQGEAVKGVQEEFQFRNPARGHKSTASSDQSQTLRCAVFSRRCRSTFRR